MGLNTPGFVYTFRSMRQISAVKHIIWINILVFLLWFLIPEFMFENFLVSWTGVTSGKVWQLLTSVFSHNMFFHIFINMYAFMGFGMVLESVLGKRRFLTFYLTAGIVASLAHCIVSYVLMNDPDLPALGASGAVSGVVMLFSLMFPKEKILLLGIIPLPSMFAALVIVGLDVWGLVAQTQGGTLPIGHGAHLGGALCGVIYYLAFRNTSLKTRQPLF
jgi:membrane associated rhomboid family serine protease